MLRRLKMKKSAIYKVCTNYEWEHTQLTVTSKAKIDDFGNLFFAPFEKIQKFDS